MGPTAAWVSALLIIPPSHTIPVTTHACTKLSAPAAAKPNGATPPAAASASAAAAAGDGWVWDPWRGESAAAAADSLVAG